MSKARRREDVGGVHAHLMRGEVNAADGQWNVARGAAAIESGKYMKRGMANKARNATARSKRGHRTGRYRHSKQLLF